MLKQQIVETGYPEFVIFIKWMDSDILNWSKLLRRYVESVVEQEGQKLKPKRDSSVIKMAVEGMDRLAKISEGSGWIAEEEVFKWRRERYSYLMRA